MFADSLCRFIEEEKQLNIEFADDLSGRFLQNWKKGNEIIIIIKKKTTQKEIKIKKGVVTF